MKSCIEWRKSFKYLPQIDEFNIDFRPKEGKLLDFLEMYGKSQRVNIRLPEDYKVDDLGLLTTIYRNRDYNIVIILPDKYYAHELKEDGVPFYFGKPIYDWDMLDSCLDSGVSDVIISGALGFELDKVSKVCKARGVQVRCYANIAQSNGWTGGDGFKKFFIRPEDVDIYGEYVDVIEFYDSVDRQNILYEIYFKDKEWVGDLREIIKGMQLKINNYYILGSEFARRRSQCGKRCFKGERCALCDNLAELAQTLEDSKEYEVFKRRE